tara:strand:- start:3416 stop:5254 length:1839 start_codon:yes stop_codon:yes gene_type:complete
MIKNFKFIIVLFLSISGYSQNFDDLEEQLNLLPESVRNSVLERMEGDNSLDTNSKESILLGTETESDKEMEINEFDKFDLLKGRFDRYGSIIPKPFGYDLFKNYDRPSDSLIQSAPADYVLGPGDELRINFYGSVKASRKVKIDREGNIFLKELGTLNFSGLSFRKTEEELNRIVEASLIGTEASISLIKVRPIQIFIVGQSMKPGSYNLNALASISTALFESGGPNSSGSLRNITLKRSNEVIGKLDLYELFIKGNSSANLKIQSGDVLLINPVEKKVEIFGEVNTQAIFELTEGEDFDDLISYASGLKLQADKAKIVLTRESLDNTIFVKEMTLSEIRKFPLKSGDSIFVDRLPIISVDANKDRRESVTLEGAFKNPGSYYLKKEETLSQLIERAGGYSEEAYIEAGIFLRTSVAKREKDGLTRAAIDLEKGIARALQTGQFSQVRSPDLAIRLIGNIVKQLKEARPLGRIVASFDLEKMKDNNTGLDILLIDDDRIIMPKRKSTITVSGEVLSPSSFVYSKNLNFLDYINLAGGLKDSADENNLFYLLPNGQAGKPSRNWFNNEKLLPGTVIVVPQDTTELSNLAFWKAVLPIFSNLVQTLAAIDALSD